MVQLVKRSGAAAWASFAGCGPRFGRPQIRVPKRPRSALPRSVFVHLALSRLVVEKDTIAIWEFDKAFANSDTPHVVLFEELDFDADSASQVRDFLVRNPDVPGRSRATIAAARTFELQTVLVPGFFRHLVAPLPVLISFPLYQMLDRSQPRIA